MDTASLATNNTALGTAQNSVATHFVARHAFGCHAPKSDGVQAFGASSGGKDLIDRLVYKVGKQVCVFDPDGGKQSFFENRLPNVTDILHFCVSPNSKYLSVCEVTRLEKTGEVSSQVSVYSLTTMKRMRTMPHAASKPFVCSTFCGDPKLLAALSDDPDRHIFVWQWEKEKLFKSTAVTMNANLIRSAPSTVLMLTTSGQSVMKFWHLSSDGFMKHGSFLPVSKENNEKFLDHMWLQSNLGQHRMVALVDPDHSASEGHGQKSRKQLVHIFEGVDVVAPNGSTLASSGLAPIAMELKQTLSLRLELNCKIEKIVLYSKSFMLAGSMGLICQYERSDDKHEPYIESRRISLGDLHIKMATVYPSEEKIVLLTKAGRMLTMPLDVSMDNLANAAKGSLDELDSNSIGSVDDANSSNSQERRRGNTLHGIADLTSGGYHHTAILSADLSHERPIMFTVAADSTARIWNYQTQKCELVHYFRNDEPISCAIHSAGFQALVSFKDRVRLYNVLMDKLKPYKETIMKNCKCLKFSHGSQYWAAASAITVSVYDTKTFTQLMSFQGHMMTVVKLSWAAGDQILFSAGMDGNVYGWPIFKEGRIDVIAANNRSSAVLDLIVDSPSTIFTNTKQTNNDSGDVDHNEFGEFGNPVSPTNANSSVLKKKEKAGNSSELTTLQILEKRYALIISSLDGSLKLPSWSFESVKASSVGKSVSSDNMQIINGDPSVAITALALNSDRTKLYAGTSVGSLRVYQWPPSDEKHNRRRSSHHYTQHTTSSAVAASAVSVTDTSKYDSSQFYELFSHSTAVISITLSPQENILMSAAADGSVFIHNIVNETAKEEIKVDDPFELNSDAIVLNSEVVLMSLEDIEDHVNEVVELQKTLNETKAKNEFNSRKLESEHNDTIKKMTEVHDATITKEKDNFEKQRIAFDRRIRELMAAIEAKETDHIKVITELENKYEHKLADQLERYDMLSEKMQLLKQKCEGLLEAEKNNFHKQLNDVKDEARTREKKLKIENRRALEDKSANEAAFKEIVNQQEEEYEDELKQLIGAAESELVSERETILKLRTLVQTKNTKLDQLKKKLVELSTSSKARLTLLNHERAEKQKLYDTIEHYKKNLIERENALAEKEKMVLELRSTTRTLENFRFVLDHRLQQLSSERGPITNHIEGLEKHISTMYEELVDEFTNKKATQEASHLKDQKISWISRDLIKTKQLVREKEHVIEAFKRELGNVISSMVIGKELEEAIKLLYKKFVRGETVGQAFVRISDAAVEVADELLIDDDERTILSLDAPVVKNGVGNKMSSNRFVRDVEEALVEKAKEADRQKKYVETQSENLKHRLGFLRKETHVESKRRLTENSKLLYECNELRVQVKNLERQLDVRSAQQELADRNVESLKRQLLALQEVQKKIGSPKNRSAPSKATTPARLQSTIREEGLGATSPPTQDVPINEYPQSVRNAADHWLVHSALRQDRQISGPLSSGSMDNTKNAKMQLSKSMPNFGARRESSNSNQPNKPSGSESHPALTVNARLTPIMTDSINDFSAMSPATGMTIASSGVVAGTRLKTPKGRNTQKQLSINVPKTDKKKKSGNPDIHFDKLSKEVEYLALQLDDSQREREMQKLELSKLRKQLMQLSGAHSSSFINSAISQEGSGSVMSDKNLPSITSGSNILGNADLTGAPSEAEKRGMRLGPAARQTNSNSSIASGSSRKKSSRGNYRAAMPQVLQDPPSPMASVHSMGAGAGNGDELHELSLHSQGTRASR